MRNKLRREARNKHRWLPARNYQRLDVRQAGMSMIILHKGRMKLAARNVEHRINLPAVAVFRYSNTESHWDREWIRKYGLWSLCWGRLTALAQVNMCIHRTRSD